MSESIDDERERIRERKKRELRERLENGGELRDDSSAATETPSEPIRVDGQDHLASIVSEHDVVLVDFHADWCGPCQMLEPTVEALAAESPAAVAKIDIDANQRLAQQHGVRGVPTLVLYADGEVVEQVSGVQDRARLEGLIERYA